MMWCTGAAGVEYKLRSGPEKNLGFSEEKFFNVLKVLKFFIQSF